MKKLRKLFDRTFLLFLLVGAANTLLGTAVMFLSYNLLGFSYWVSSALNYICGGVLSYFLNKYVTFKNTSRDPKIVLKFIVNLSVCYLVAYGLAKPLVQSILAGATVSLQDNLSMLVGMGLYTILNYFGQRFFAFK